jgi:F0F1-type ATP synthase membrane subunit b/b'
MSFRERLVKGMSASLDRLRKAEEEARLDVEAARRRAREIRMGIPGAVEKLRARGREKLDRARSSMEDDIQREISEIHSRLDGRVERRLEELESLRGDLAAKAAEKLAEVIGGGS